MYLWLPVDLDYRRRDGRVGFLVRDSPVSDAAGRPAISWDLGSTANVANKEGVVGGE